MKPIRWRKVNVWTHAKAAKVEGIEMTLWYSGTDLGPMLDAGPVAGGLTLRSGSNRQQIDAAAYALADLVATLKGME